MHIAKVGHRDRRDSGTARALFLFPQKQAGITQHIRPCRLRTGVPLCKALPLVTPTKGTAAPLLAYPTAAPSGYSAMQCSRATGCLAATAGKPHEGPPDSDGQVNVPWQAFFMISRVEYSSLRWNREGTVILEWHQAGTKLV